MPKMQFHEILLLNLHGKYWKIIFREIEFLVVLNFFPVQKLILGHFWNCKKWKLVKKFFVKLIYLISRVFLACTFFRFSGPLCVSYDLLTQSITRVCQVFYLLLKQITHKGKKLMLYDCIMCIALADKCL